MEIKEFKNNVSDLKSSSIDLKSLDNELVQLSNRQPNDTITMLNLSDEIKQLKNNQDKDFYIYIKDDPVFGKPIPKKYLKYQFEPMLLCKYPGINASDINFCDPIPKGGFTSFDLNVSIEVSRNSDTFEHGDRFEFVLQAYIRNQSGISLSPTLSEKFFSYNCRYLDNGDFIIDGSSEPVCVLFHM